MSGAATVLAEDLADCVDSLVELFDDVEPDVRAAASRGMRNLDGVAPHAIDPLSRSSSAAKRLTSAWRTFSTRSKQLGTAVPPTALFACEQATEVGAGELGDIRTARAAIGRHLIAVVLRLYRQGNPQTWARCLDVIDRLIELNVYGVDDALSEER